MSFSQDKFCLNCFKQKKSFLKRRTISRLQDTTMMERKIRIEIENFEILARKLLDTMTDHQNTIQFRDYTKIIFLIWKSRY